MNIIEIEVSFEKRSIRRIGVDLVTGDYNSTKVIFSFDKEYEGKKIFELANPEGEVIFIKEIPENNEIVLVSYLDNKEVSIFSEVGKHIFEISLYGENSKLTSASSSLRVKKEQVQVGDIQVEKYIPIFDDLINRATALENELTETIEDIQRMLESGELNGQPGKDGYTPQKGVDYYTDKEKEDSKNEILDEITPTLNSNLKESKDYTDNAIIKDFKDISYNKDTCTFIFTRHDNTTFTVDLPIENTVKDGRYDADTAELVLVLVSGQEIRIPVSGLIDDYTGVDSATIQIVISADNKITCNIKSGSISKTLLTTELQEELNDKVGTEVFNQELGKKLSNSDIQEKTYEITYEDGTVETVRSVVFK